MSEHVEHLPLPTVREILTLPEVSSGAPEVVASDRALDAAVRWVHVVAGTTAHTLLDGGELLLTTGAGWPQEADALRSLARSLLDAGAAAIALELGTHFTEAPAALRGECLRADVALVILHRETRFVQVTQRVHRRILTAQSEALQARVQVHRMLTELGLNRSPVDFVVEQISATLDAPVILANLAGEVVAWSGHADAAAPAEPLVDGPVPKTEPAGSAHPAGPIEATEEVAVEARGTRWGTLTALPGPPHPAGRRTVLELGAFALALGRLADSEGDQWIDARSKQLIDDLLSGRYRRDVDIQTQLEASGLPVDGRTLVAVAVSSTGSFGSHASLERAVVETALRRAVAPDGRAIIAVERGNGSGGWADAGASASTTGSSGAGSAAGVFLFGLLSFPPTASDSDVSTSTAGGSALAERLSRELSMLVPTTAPHAWRVHVSIGVPGRGVRGLLSSAEGVRAVGRLTPTARVGRVDVQQATRQPLAHLIGQFAGLPALQEFTRDTLGPLIEHDRASGPGHSGDLIDVLRAYLAYPTNRSLAAARARLSRSVFYQRLARIEDLLGVDLADGETIATLAVALAARPR